AQVTDLEHAWQVVVGDHRGGLSGGAAADVEGVEVEGEDGGVCVVLHAPAGASAVHGLERDEVRIRRATAANGHDGAGRGGGRGGDGRGRAGRGAAGRRAAGRGAAGAARCRGAGAAG